MKYLGIHKALWFILVLLLTIFELWIVFLATIVNFLWNFKFRFGYYWKVYHEEQETVYNSKTEEFNEILIPSKSIKETFVYRLNYWKNEN